MEIYLHATYKDDLDLILTTDASSGSNLSAFEWNTPINILASVLAMLLLITCCTVCLLWCKFKKRKKINITATDGPNETKVATPQYHPSSEPDVKLATPSISKVVHKQQPKIHIKQHRSIIVEGRMPTNAITEHNQREMSASTEIESASDFTLNGNVFVNTPSIGQIKHILPVIDDVIHDKYLAKDIDVAILPHIDDDTSSSSAPPTLPASLPNIDTNVKHYKYNNVVTSGFMKEDASDSSSRFVNKYDDRTTKRPTAGAMDKIFTEIMHEHHDSEILEDDDQTEGVAKQAFV